MGGTCGARTSAVRGGFLHDAGGIARAESPRTSVDSGRKVWIANLALDASGQIVSKQRDCFANRIATLSVHPAFSQMHLRLRGNNVWPIFLQAAAQPAQLERFRRLMFSLEPKATFMVQG